jgi:aminopeptidase YwaD
MERTAPTPSINLDSEAGTFRDFTAYIKRRERRECCSKDDQTFIYPIQGRLRMFKSKVFIGTPLILALWLPLLATTERNRSPSDAITAAKIRDRVYFLSSEALEGRYPGSQGFGIAAAYAASQFKAAGLIPAVNSQSQTSYFQPVPLARRKVEKAAVVMLKTRTGEQPFTEEDVKFITSEGLSENGKMTPVVFAGFGISEPAAGWDDLKGLELSGKIVLFMMGAPMKDGQPLLPEEVHRIYAPMNSVVRKCAAMRNAAAAFLVIGDDMLEVFKSLASVPEDTQYILDDKKPGAFRLPALGVLSPRLSKALLGGKDLPDGPAVRKGLHPNGDLEGTAMGISVSFSDERIQTQNILGLVEGTDSLLKEQVIVVSAHLDHLPPTSEGQIHPGANDNASGAAALLEIAGAVASHPPRRSVLFALFSAEEGGWMGSRYFLARCPVAAGRIVADINMDMIGRTEKGLEDSRAQYAVDSARITPAFTRLIEGVNSRTVAWPLRFVHPLNLGDSDHCPFKEFGIPSVNFYTGRIPDTHTPTDTPDKLDYEKAAQIARLVYEIAMELGNREPLWN